MTQEEMWHEIKSLKEQLDKLQPMKREDEDRLWRKFRLEWNYNSNHMEGNTLTYAHTELLLIFDQVSGDYKGREIEEMKAHDVAIKMVSELAGDKERDLNENFIRQLNEIILVRPFWSDAITQEGQPTKKEIIPGEYKKLPNSVRLANGEVFPYTAPQATPAEMNDLMRFYENSKNDPELALTPLWLAAQLHYKFVKIHPFDDGNGRVARLLMNYVLLRNNYPPIIIKDTDKKGYLAALNKADIGNEEAFLIYLGVQLIWSLHKTISAAKGESIDDDDDFEKEIELLSREKKGKNKVTVKKSREILMQIYSEYLKDLFQKIDNKLSKFDSLFAEKQLTILAHNAIESALVKSPGHNLEYIYQQICFDYNQPGIFGQIPGNSYQNNRPMKQLHYPEIYNIRIDYYWKAYVDAGLNAFNVGVILLLDFQEFKYRLSYQGPDELLIEKLYDSPITEGEMKDIVNRISKLALGALKQQKELSDKN